MTSFLGYAMRQNCAVETDVGVDLLSCMSCLAYTVQSLYQFCVVIGTTISTSLYILFMTFLESELFLFV